MDVTLGDLVLSVEFRPTVTKLPVLAMEYAEELLKSVLETLVLQPVDAVPGALAAVLLTQEGKSVPFPK
jgi:hypothetical protein